MLFFSQKLIAVLHWWWNQSCPVLAEQPTQCTSRTWTYQHNHWLKFSREFSGERLSHQKATGFLGWIRQGSLNHPFSGDQKCKSMVLLRDFPLNSASVGLVNNGPCWVTITSNPRAPGHSRGFQMPMGCASGNSWVVLVHRRPALIWVCVGSNPYPGTVTNEGF